ncbi:hypothetical protein HPP92_013099 [Vanilla planifolia]|uniref:Uncharacterized protein n=1 Tax=Vanilla planifolia TaxID=51239 RepID=A0A835QYE6_VANPL|nr:hypothetical protein HPP92_013099 [Vanilla planifolia]
MGMGSHCLGLFLLLLIVAAMLAVSLQSADAVRPMPEEANGGDGGVGLSQAYGKTKMVLATWMARLPTGPSPGGGGGH